MTSILQFLNSKYLFINCFFWIEIIQTFLNLEGASKCISKIIITPNFVKKIFVDCLKLIGELTSWTRYLSKAILVLSSKCYFRDLAFPIFLSFYSLAAYCPFQHIKFNEFTSYKNTNFCGQIINYETKTIYNFAGDFGADF